MLERGERTLSTMFTNGRNERNNHNGSVSQKIKEVAMLKLMLMTILVKYIMITEKPTFNKDARLGEYKRYFYAQ